MNITPQEFLQSLKEGKTERELNLLPTYEIDFSERSTLVRKYGHTFQEATNHLSTDYKNGFTICATCGSFYALGKGFTKHLSKGCLHCEGEEKHRVHHVNASKPSEGGFPARYMSTMFDDGMSYCKDKLQIKKFYEFMSLIPS